MYFIFAQVDHSFAFRVLMHNDLIKFFDSLFLFLLCWTCLFSAELEGKGLSWLIWVWVKATYFPTNQQNIRYNH